MRRPDERTLAGLIADAGRATNWRRTQQVLTAAIKRDAWGGRTTPDGYSRGGDSRGGPGPSTPVESTVLARQARPERDPIADATNRALSHLRDMAAAGRRLQSSVTELERLRQERLGAPVWCAWHKDAGHLVASERSTTLGGRLVEVIEVCEPCWKFGHNHDGDRPEYDGNGRLRRRVKTKEPAR